MDKKIELWLVLLIVFFLFIFSIFFGFISNKINHPAFKSIREPLQFFYDIPGKFYNSIILRKESQVTLLQDELKGIALNLHTLDSFDEQFNYLQITLKDNINYWQVKRFHKDGYEILFETPQIEGEALIYVSKDFDYFFTRSDKFNDMYRSISKYMLGEEGYQLEWKRNGINSHHQVFVNNDGNIFTPNAMQEEGNKYTNFLGRSGTKPYSDFIYRDEGFTVISHSGEVKKYSLTQILIENNLDYLIVTGPLESDPFHVNSVVEASKDFPKTPVKKGDILLSLRHKSMLILYRPTTNEVIWYKAGPWLNQHDATFTEEGDIMLFNNNIVSVISQRVAENYYFNSPSKNQILIYSFEKDSTNEKHSYCKHDSLFTITGGQTKNTGNLIINSYSDMGLNIICSKENKEVIAVLGNLESNTVIRGSNLAESWLQDLR